MLLLLTIIKEEFNDSSKSVIYFFISLVVKNFIGRYVHSMHIGFFNFKTYICLFEIYCNARILGLYMCDAKE